MPTASPLPRGENMPMTPVVIDPGHGGEDMGAVINGVKEKDIALAVALKLRDRLKDEMPVALTRDTDTYVTLDQRLVLAVDWEGALFISLHLNQVKSKKLSGATVYSYGPETRRSWRRRNSHPKVPPMPAPPRIAAKESDALAAIMVKTMREDGLRVEQDKSDYYVLKNPAQPSILIELGYLSNPAEWARLKDPLSQDKLAATMAKAIERFIGERSLHASLQPPEISSPSVVKAPPPTAP